MSILRRFVEERVDAVPKWQGTVPLTSDVILTSMGMDVRGGAPGTIVGTKQVLGIAAMARATAVLGGSIAGLDKSVIKRKGDKVNESHRLIYDPHPIMDEFIFWEQVVIHLLYRGNFYAYIQRGADGRTVKALHPLNPDSVKPKAIVKNDASGREVWVDVAYTITPGEGGEEYALSQSEIFHIAGLGFDGLQGLSLLSYARRVFESTMNSDEFAAKFYANGSLMSGILTTDKRLDEKSAEGLKQRWRRKVQGIGNAHDIVVLDSGVKFEQISLSPEDAQWLESRDFNVHEMARITGVPPHLLMVSDKGSGQGGQTSEQKSIDFVLFTVHNWTNRIASAVTKQLLPSTERMVFKTKQLIQPDERTLSSAAVMWRTAQVKSINELRGEQGLPRVEKPEADDPMHAAVKANPNEPGGNQGKQEQPVPTDQTPTDDNPGDNNLA